jgi:chemotaxis protein CheD
MRPVTDYQRHRGTPPTLIGVGGIAWSGEVSTVYSTLLGSCIAVCLWDPQAMKGGITHFLLANAPEQPSDDTRYGDVAVPLLADSLCQVGCRFDRLQAIVAGGSDVLNNMKPIGTENTHFALAWLREKKIVIVRKDVGGGFARRVRFSPSTGVCEITSIVT